MRPFIVYVVCGDCRGAGKVVHARMTQAIRAVQPRPQWTSTAEVAARMGIGATNAANLLRRLLDLGDVHRRGSGSRHSPYEWSRR